MTWFTNTQYNKQTFNLNSLTSTHLLTASYTSYIIPVAASKIYLWSPASPILLSTILRDFLMMYISVKYAKPRNHCIFNMKVIGLRILLNINNDCNNLDQSIEFIEHHCDMGVNICIEWDDAVTFCEACDWHSACRWGLNTGWVQKRCLRLTTSSLYYCL